VFTAAERAIPHVAEWIDPARSRPIGPVRPGAGFNNSYRGQVDVTGALGLPGLVAVGDAVCTTTPLAGRGVALALLQAHRLVTLVDAHPGDPEAVALALEEWCTSHIRPWFDDHVYSDADRVRRRRQSTSPGPCRPTW
jgi:2-polyprenyl-6-methoxyphenol hydroxylase-like FAD-dependent oxidoreductase